jgi:hypothetical protein
MYFLVPSQLSFLFPDMEQKHLTIAWHWLGNTGNLWWLTLVVAKLSRSLPSENHGWTILKFIDDFPSYPGEETSIYRCWLGNFVHVWFHQALRASRCAEEGRFLKALTAAVVPRLGVTCEVNKCLVRTSEHLRTPFSSWDSLTVFSFSEIELDFP